MNAATRITLAAVTVTTGLTGVAAPAEARTTDPAGLTTNRHAVVQSSTLPHCKLEDGSGAQALPCTWNIGPGQDGNGRGAAYWVGPHGGTHYVWTAARVERLQARGWRWSHRYPVRMVKSGRYLRPSNGTA